MKLSVIIPVYNEKGTVLELLDRVRAVGLDKEVIIVDNCSTDGTREIVEGLSFPDVHVILQPTNLRKGNSVRRGLAAAQGEFMVVQDADLEYDPQDHVPMLAEAEQEDVLAVFGSRVLGARQSGRALPSTAFSVGREGITGLFRLLYGSSLTDIATCYKMMRVEVARRLDLRCDGFDLDFEVACKLTLLSRREGKRIAEAPIRYAPRTVAEGKKISWRDGLAALGAITRYRSWRPAPEA